MYSKFPLDNLKTVKEVLDTYFHQQTDCPPDRLMTQVYIRQGIN